MSTSATAPATCSQCYDTASRTAKLSCRARRDETSSRRASSGRTRKSRWLPAEPQSLWSEQGAVYMGFGFQTEAWETFAAALREHGQQNEVKLIKETGF